jgi:hypothetical protein
MLKCRFAASHCSDPKKEPLKDQVSGDGERIYSVIDGRVEDDFDRIFVALATEGRKPERIMIDATHLKAHRTAASLAQKGAFPAVWDEQKAEQNGANRMGAARAQ